MKYNLNWFSGSAIDTVHSSIPVTQVYGWLYTSDQKLILVSKDSSRWQFPGGHPDSGETLLQTLTREIWEETNIDISSFVGKAIFFGYYVVDEIDDKNQVIKRYLQIRFFVSLPFDCSNLSLKTNENKNDETAQMRDVKPVSLMEAISLIPWLKDSAEYKTLIDSGLIQPHS